MAMAKKIAADIKNLVLNMGSKEFYNIACQSMTDDIYSIGL
jgi:hypothetical protein